ARLRGVRAAPAGGLRGPTEGWGAARRTGGRLCPGAGGALVHGVAAPPPQAVIGTHRELELLKRDRAIRRGPGRGGSGGRAGGGCHRRRAAVGRRAAGGRRARFWRGPAPPKRRGGDPRPPPDPPPPPRPYAAAPPRPA